MCQTVPLKILSIKKNKAKVKNHQDKTYFVDTSLVEKLKKGDWVLANANLAFYKITNSEAKEILKFYVK